MNWRRLGRWLVIASICATFLAVVVVWQVGGALIAPANRIVGEPPNDFPATTVSFPSESGAEIVGWFRQLPGSSATVILLHPLRADRRAMLERARWLTECGYSTLLIDLQAHGESQNEQITVGYLERYDVQAAVNFAREKSPEHQIAIIGRSLGGAAAVYANADVDALVLESVYSSVEKAIHNRVEMRLGRLHGIFAPLLLWQLEPRLGVAADRLRPIDELWKISCPILFAAGECDRHTTWNETESMYEAANEPKRLVTFPGAGHDDLFAANSELYQKEILSFLTAELSGSIVNVD